MTEEEAKRILDAADEEPWIEPGFGDNSKHVRLDGAFTINELEAVIVLKRAAQRRDERAGG